MDASTRTRVALALSALALIAAVASRFATVLATSDTHFVDFVALHGDQLILELQDTRLNAWILAWVQHAAVSDPTALFDGNAFYPARSSITGSEHLFGIALQTLPLRMFTTNAIALHQLALVLSTLLLATTSFSAVRWLTGSIWAALVAGALSVWMPWRVTEISHLQLVSAQLFPYVWVTVLRGLLGEARTRDLVGLALALTLQLLSSFYLAYFLSFSSLVLVAVAVAMRRPRISDVARLGFAVLPGYLLFALSAIPYLKRQAESDLSSVYLTDFPGDLAREWSMLAPRLPAVGEMLNPDYTYYLPWGAALLALVSLGLLLRSRSSAGEDPFRTRTRLAVAALFSICAFGFVMMLGGSLELGSFKLYLPAYAFSQLLPGFSMVRGASRWSILINVAVPLLAGIGAWSLDRAVRARNASSWLRIGSRIALAAAVASTLDFYRIPTRAAWSNPARIDARYEALAKLEPGPLLEIPWTAGPGNATLSSLNMLASTRHWRPLLNGYSGHLPASYRFLQRVGRRLPDRPAIRRLRDFSGLRWILVDVTKRSPKQIAAWTRAARGGALRTVYRDDSTRIYEVIGWERGAVLMSDLLSNEPRESTFLGHARAPLALTPPGGKLSVATNRKQSADLYSWATVSVTNQSAQTWPGFDTQPEGLVFLRYTYRPEDPDGVEQTRLARLDVDFPPRKRTVADVLLRAPNAGGRYRLCFDLAQLQGDRIERLPVESFDIGVQVAVAGDRGGIARFIDLFYDRGEDPPACGGPGGLVEPAALR